MRQFLPSPALDPPILVITELDLVPGNRTSTPFLVILRFESAQSQLLQ